MDGPINTGAECACNQGNGWAIRGLNQHLKTLKCLASNLVQIKETQVDFFQNGNLTPKDHTAVSGPSL